MNAIKSEYELKSIDAGHGRMRKLFEILLFITTPRTIQQIAERFDMTTRSVYRYLHTLESFDLSIDKDFSDRYFLTIETCPVCGNINENNIEHESTGEEREASPRASENLVAAGPVDNTEPSFKDVENLKAGSVHLPIETRLSPNANR